MVHGRLAGRPVGSPACASDSALFSSGSAPRTPKMLCFLTPEAGFVPVLACHMSHYG
jgi:hypothetical protein